MIEPSCEIEGMDDLQKQLASLVDLARQKQITQTCSRYALKEMYDDVKLSAPMADEAYYRYYRGSARARKRGNSQNSRKLVQPGTLRDSIAFKRLKLDKSVGVGIYVKNKAFYWRFPEYGTPNMAAEPFLRNNFDSHKEKAVARFKVRYKKYIDQIIKKQRATENAGD